MVKLRLARVGAKKRPLYRLVATDARNARDGRFIEILGAYDPNTAPKMTGLNEERVFYWLDNGARMSDTVLALLKGQGVLRRWRMQGEPSVSEDEAMFLDQEQEEEEEEEDVEGAVEPETSETDGEVTGG